MNTRYQQLTKTEDFSAKFDPGWITTEITEDCIRFTESFGSFLAKKGFSSSQFRNVYGEIKRIQFKGFGTNKTDFLLLKPKLAYASSRASDYKKKEAATQFERLIAKAHTAVAVGTNEDLKRFENFCDFVEAILAYHKAKGGKD